MSTIGKLFFRIGTGNFVCSGSVIGTSRVITAGHCVSNGNGTFATNVQFCPSYNNSGVNPARGCWASAGLTTSSAWHFSGDPDYDYARITTAATGTLRNNAIGNVTGTLGYGWNWGDAQPDHSFGYPAGSPFNGNRIHTVASTNWYTHDFTTGNQVSKIMGNDLTGGSSGGPWILRWNHPSAEAPDTDGNNATDPGGLGFPFVNGVNSHKRCVTSCQSPPTATNGVFWQEMTSPPFIQSSTDNQDVTDVINAP
jgi:V8-like Glu-specific endopeptidase